MGVGFYEHEIERYEIERYESQQDIHAP
jgi:hypothetical protein